MRGLRHLRQCHRQADDRAESDRRLRRRRNFALTRPDRKGTETGNILGNDAGRRRNDSGQRRVGWAGSPDGWDAAVVRPSDGARRGLWGG